MASQIVLQDSSGKPLVEVKENAISEMGLLQIALQNNAAIDVIERIAALVKDARTQKAEEEFNEHMTAVQHDIPVVVPDLKNDQSKKKYESYKALDDAVRPIYLQHGFSLSFGFGQPLEAGNVRVICHVSRGLHTRLYQGPDFPADGLGPKGTGVLSKADATAGAGSRGRRQLLKFIFNIVVAEDHQMDQDELRERIALFAKCQTIAEVFEHFKASFMEAESAGDVKAQIALSEAKDNRKKEIQNARAKG